jgi:hypothetical protein
MTTNTGPDQVLIIRHGEKLGDPKTDSDGGPDLSIRGSARAAAVPSLFVPAQPEFSCPLAQSQQEFTASYKQIKLQGQPPRLPTPDFIFATKESSHSNRPIETVTPLATALQLTINNGFSDKQKHITAMANEILTTSIYAGKIVLICWHHGTIPNVAIALGAWNPPGWKGTVFDRVWQITYAGGGELSLQDLPQMLLYGDSTS